MTGNARYAPIVVSASPGRPRDAEALLERLRRTAVSELARHLPEGALCGWCGEVWPCDRARLADLALS
jgi:hypothetical protein